LHFAARIVSTAIAQPHASVVQAQNGPQLDIIPNESNLTAGRLWRA
jgi:hypothetical protein